MNSRRKSLSWLLALSALPLITAGLSRATARKGPALRKTDAQWAALLPSNAFQVLFKDGTERAGTSPLNAEKRDGTYLCAACFQPLFASANKYESGTGWPSFWQPLPEAVATKTDFKAIFPRTEYHCSRCEGHQGHIFDDGPQPTGKRYCNNGVALRFVPRADALPELRT